MWTSVVAAWREFNAPNEGIEPFMYLDVKLNVTTSMGVLLPDVASAQALPWKNPDGSLTSAADVEAAFNAVKARTDLAPKFGGAFEGVTVIRLDADGIQQAIQTRLTPIDTELTKSLPGWASMPADAQMGTASKAWAMGPDFITVYGFTKFAAAMNAGQFSPQAIAQGKYKGPGTQRRQAQEAVCFANAQAVHDAGSDPSVLHWPDVLAEPPPSSGSGKAAAALGVVVGVMVMLGGTWLALAKGWV